MSQRRSFLLRIDPQLHEELERWAQQDMRSVNGQIEFLLREAVVRRLGRTPRATGSSAATTSATDDAPHDPG